MQKKNMGKNLLLLDKGRRGGAQCTLDPTLSMQSLPLKVGRKWFNLRWGSTMAQNDRAGEYINFKWAHFCLDSDSSDSDSYSDSDIDGDSYIGWLWFNLW